MKICNIYMYLNANFYKKRCLNENYEMKHKRVLKNIFADILGGCPTVLRLHIYSKNCGERNP